VRKNSFEESMKYRNDQISVLSREIKELKLEKGNYERMFEDKVRELGLEKEKNEKMERELILLKNPLHQRKLSNAYK
jgi:hypothetical protein